MVLYQQPVAEAAMRIWKPVAEVFEAFVDPAITSRFWFTGGSARLAAGETVKWEWAMYGFSIDVHVIELEENRRIVVEWGPPDQETTVEWRFTARPDGSTFVHVTNSGFHGDDDAVVRQAIDSAGGFALVLAGAKALLEHGIELKLVADRHPDGFAAM